MHNPRCGGFSSQHLLTTSFTAYPQGNILSQYYRNSFVCNGAYTLCAYAECKITYISTDTNKASIAECGCYNFTGENFGGTPGILGTVLKTANRRKCSAACSNCENNLNEAPMCEAQKPGKDGKVPIYGKRFQVISAASDNWPGSTTTMTTCTVGQFTNCYSAACQYVRAWNGAPTTCYCPVYNVLPSSNLRFFMSNPTGNCTGSTGFRVGSRVWNGAAVGPAGAP